MYLAELYPRQAFRLRSAIRFVDRICWIIAFKLIPELPQIQSYVARIEARPAVARARAMDALLARIPQPDWLNVLGFTAYCCSELTAALWGELR
jgi:hypothetical protein